MTGVQPENILRELAGLWISLGGEQGDHDPQGVLRACTMTVFVLADDADDPSAIWESVAAVMPHHPARAVLVRLGEDGGRSLQSRVFAQCWLPFGQRRQICCEQIEISGGYRALADLPPVLMPLAAPDLPVVIWSRCRRTFASRELPELFPAATRIVVDSRGAGEPRTALRELAARAGEGPPFADLAWASVSRWRELVARVFENRAYLEGLPRTSEVTIGFTGDHPPVQAWYLAAWTTLGVRRAGGAARHRFEQVAGDTAGQIRSLVFGGAEPKVSISLTERGCAESRAGESVSRMAMPPQPDYALLDEELGVTGRDPVYEEALSEAARLAVSLGA